MFQMPIRMLGQRMELAMSEHAGTRVMERSSSETPDEVLMRVALLLEREDVADYLLNEVRIGDGAVILDEDNGCSYAVVMDVGGVSITTVYYTKSGRHQRVAQNQFCILLKNAEVVAASLFCEIRGCINAMV